MRKQRNDNGFCKYKFHNAVLTFSPADDACAGDVLFWYGWHKKYAQYHYEWLHRLWRDYFAVDYRGL